MLKKLAKYGNSTTLVIDKAILELLNMDESSIVKLQTDGKSLIITPTNAASVNDKISYDTYEAMEAAKQATIKKMPKMPRPLSDEETKELQKSYSDIFSKYRTDFWKFSHEIFPSEKYQNELQKITEKYDPSTQNVEYLRECNKLKVQFCPELAAMDEEMDALNTSINKKYSQIK